MFDKVKAINKSVFVEKYDKVKKAKDASPFSSLPTNDSLGVVRFVDSELVEKYPVGTKVFYKNKFERLFINGYEFLVMEDSNIVAILDDE